MSQTDTRPGFRLPWTGERNDAEQPTDTTSNATSGEPAADATPEASGQPNDEADMAVDPTPSEELVTTDLTDATAIAGSRRPTKFMADLSRAMQSAAEASRDETMLRFGADAKTAVEEIRSGSAEEAAALRRRADDDVAAVREWSKTEIARIREETDARIAARKQGLDGEMDAFAAVIEARVERVNTTVAEFEGEMAEFFERLIAEQDPTRIATMAQAMPDPPDLAAIAATVTEAAPRVDETPAETTDEPVAETAPDVADAPIDFEYPTGSGDEVVADVESPAEDAPADDAPDAEDIPQVEPDFAAAEAEAAVMSSELDADDGLTMLAAARLDSIGDDLAAAEAPVERSSNGDRVTTRVVVLGLVSVASIATFKRSLGRVSGVSAIGVASGPDGEFVFTVSHDSGLALADAITGLPGFDARISNETPDGLEVAAHDPDAGD